MEMEERRLWEMKLYDMNSFSNHPSTHGFFYQSASKAKKIPKDKIHNVNSIRSATAVKLISFQDQLNSALPSKTVVA